MIASCSDWIVATMSDIRPVRRAPTAASRAASLVRPLLWDAAEASSRSSTSSSTASTSRRRVRRCLRLRMPSGEAAVAV